MSNSWIELFNLEQYGSGSIRSRRGKLRSDGTYGKPRFTIEVTSEPIQFLIDSVEIGKEPAEAIGEAIRTEIQNISETASKGTLNRRKQAAKDFEKGAAWAQARYSGGVIGPMAPNQSDRLFNDSGRLARSIKATLNRTDKSWTVNVASNRLNPTGFDPFSKFDAMVQKLKSLVPIIGDPRKVMSHPKVEQAMRSTLESAIAKTASLKSDLRRAQLRTLKMAASLIGL